MNSERLYTGNKYLDNAPGSFALDVSNELIAVRALMQLAYQDYNPSNPETARILWRTIRSFAYIANDCTKLRATLCGQALVHHIIARMNEELPADVRGPAVLQFQSLLDQAVFASEINTMVGEMDSSIPCDEYKDCGIPDKEEDPDPNFVVRPEIVPEMVVPPYIVRLGENVGYRFLDAWRKANPNRYSIGEELHLSRRLSAATLTTIVAAHSKQGYLNTQLLALWLDSVKVTFAILRASMKGIVLGGNRDHRLKSFIRDSAVEQLAVQVCSLFDIDAFKLEIVPKFDLGSEMTDLLPCGNRSMQCGSGFPPLRLIQ